MYSEEIKHVMPCSGDGSHLNKLRINYFENRSCLTNVLDFLDQEVVIMPSSYFSDPEGANCMMEDGYINVDITDFDKWELVYNSLYELDYEGYNLSILNNYLTIVNGNRCIFTNKDMEEGEIIGTIFWVRNFNELLKKFEDRNLKRVSKAVICPYITKITSSMEELEYFEEGLMLLDADFFMFMEIYIPEVIFKYTIDTYMSNICIDVYNKLAESGLNGLVDKYIPSYKQCDGYGEKGVEENYNEKLCECSGIRAFCYLDI